MKHGKGLCIFSLCLICIFVTGCGDTLLSLTAEEELAIVSYSARVVAKNNAKQPDGQKTTSAVQTEIDAEELMITDDTQVMTATEDATSTEEKMQARMDSASIASVLQLENITSSYLGMELTMTYEENNSYSFTPQMGNQFLVLNVELTNTGGQSVNIDLLSKKPVYQISWSNDLEYMAFPTILLNDLGTIQDELGPNEKLPCVIVFQVPEFISEVNEPVLSITIDGNTNQIQL